MSTTKYKLISKLRNGKEDCKIKVRIMRMWRGATKTGEPFRGFNLLLMDAKNNRIHAFVPGNWAEEIERKIVVKNMFVISSFVVQSYKTDEKFRCVHSEIQIVLYGDTKIKDIEEDDTISREELFDFYDHADLKSIADKNVYLTDVVGAIQNCEHLRQFKNKNGVDQEQIKFSITDGSSNVSVTFWDRFAVMFQEEMLKILETPVIIIIASCKVALWNGGVELSNTGSSTFLLNSTDSSVRSLRKSLKKTGYVEKHVGKPRKKNVDLHTIESIQLFGKEYIEMEVIAHVNIKVVDETQSWYRYVCTACKRQLEIHHEKVVCLYCSRFVPHPDKKFQLVIIAADKTGEIEVVLSDREVRTIIGRRVYDITEEEETNSSFPQILRDIANHHYTIKLKIYDFNVARHIKSYTATGICKGFYTTEEQFTKPTDYMQISEGQTSSANIHLDGISQMIFESEDMTNTMAN